MSTPNYLSILSVASLIQTNFPSQFIDGSENVRILRLHTYICVTNATWAAQTRPGSAGCFLPSDEQDA